MERLLDENDYRFLAQQPGYRRYIADELRAERKKVFQLYLSELVRDFNALVRIARLMLVYAPQDSPELARAIFRTQCAFYYQVTLTHLYLAAPGLVTGSVRPARLLEALKVMRGSIDQIGFSPALLQS